MGDVLSLISPNLTKPHHPLHPPTTPPTTRYVRVANLNEAGLPLPGYLLRATCFPSAGAKGDVTGNSTRDVTSDRAAPVLPCPSPDPEGQECMGRGTCKTDGKVRLIWMGGWMYGREWMDSKAKLNPLVPTPNPHHPQPTHNHHQRSSPPVRCHPASATAPPASPAPAASARYSPSR